MRVEAINLSKTYQDAGGALCVLKSLSCSFESGRSYSIVGRSGIGKSTLLHVLGGLDRPSSGAISYDGTFIESFNDDTLSDLRGEKVGFIFQFHHLLPEFTALENVAMPLLIAGWDESKAASQAETMLANVELSNRASHRPGELSGGEQQRVSVARALVRKPALILADEPTGNLDTETGLKVQSLLVELNKAHGSTLIVATHNLELARSLDTRFEMQTGGNLRMIA